MSLTLKKELTPRMGVRGVHVDAPGHHLFPMSTGELTLTSKSLLLKRGWGANTIRRTRELIRHAEP